MKKNILFTGLATLIVFIFSSCEKEECKTCIKLIYDKNDQSTPIDTVDGSLAEYCDEKLESLENEQPETFDWMVKKWKCE